jgi:hypothetical protein
MYSRTQNENGTYNTRCLYCFMTVASAVETDAALEALELRHICPEKALAQLREQELVLAGQLPSKPHVESLPN